MHFFTLHYTALRSAVAWPLGWWMCQKIQRAHNFVGNCILFLSAILFIGIYCCSCWLVCCILFGALISFLDKHCENCCHIQAGQSVSKLLNLFVPSLMSVHRSPISRCPFLVTHPHFIQKESALNLWSH